jgi:hypothetical protein
MARHPNIDQILRQWPYEPNAVNVRVVKGSDGREVIQMRIEMGILQLEMTGRPDGERPQGFATFFDYLREEARRDPDLVMTEEQCAESMREFGRAIEDADHTLGLMNFCRQHSPDESWTITHEQYRPFVMFHRTQAATLHALEEQDAEAAVEQVNTGLDQLRTLFVAAEGDDAFEENELVERLVDLRESVREKFSVGRTLQEQLGDAIASEQYELAAQLRDQLANRENR